MVSEGQGAWRVAMTGQDRTGGLVAAGQAGCVNTVRCRMDTGGVTCDVFKVVGNHLLHNIRAKCHNGRAGITSSSRQHHEHALPSTADVG